MAKVRRIEKPAKIVGERGGERRHACAGFDEMLRPSRCDRPAADDDRSLAAKLEKNRQMAHGYRARDRIAHVARPAGRG